MKAVQAMAMDTTSADLALLRLMQLVSPSLPVGAFAYSQGLEWAVESRWIGTAAEAEDWLADQLRAAVTHTDLPLLLRMQAAAAAGDRTRLDNWIDLLLAARESAELRAEEAGRGRALSDLLAALGIFGEGSQLTAQDTGAWRRTLARSQLAAFAVAAAAWRIAPREAALGYAWCWLENLALAAVKLVPLGQTDGQRMLARLLGDIPAAVDTAFDLADDDIGASSPALAIASCGHETQYTRLFRS